MPPAKFVIEFLPPPAIRTFQRQVAHFRTVAPQIDKLLSVEYRVRRLLVVIAQPRIASPIVRPQIVMQ
jgi:hypothetical protein